MPSGHLFYLSSRSDLPISLIFTKALRMDQRADRHTNGWMDGHARMYSSSSLDMNELVFQSHPHWHWHPHPLLLLLLLLLLFCCCCFITSLYLFYCFVVDIVVILFVVGGSLVVLLLWRNNVFHFMRKLRMSQAPMRPVMKLIG